MRIGGGGQGGQWPHRPVRHFFIEFKFQLSFSFSKMFFTISSLKNITVLCRYFRNMFFSAIFVRMRNKKLLTSLSACTGCPTKHDSW